MEFFVAMNVVCIIMISIFLKLFFCNTEVLKEAHNSFTITCNLRINIHYNGEVFFLNIYVQDHNFYGASLQITLL